MPMHDRARCQGAPALAWEVLKPVDAYMPSVWYRNQSRICTVSYSIGLGVGGRARLVAFSQLRSDHVAGLCFESLNNEYHGPDAQI